MFARENFQKNWQANIAIQLFCVAILLLNACASQQIIATSIPNSSPTSIQFSKANTPTLTLTPKPTFTPSITPTVDVMTALASEFNVPTVCLFDYQVSKDRNWVGADCNVFKELIIIQKGSKNKITIPYQDILDKNLTAFTVKPLSWSSDSRYFYFTTATVCCSVYNQYEGNGALYQYDTKINSWGILVKASYKPYYFFSDDGERFVYIKQFNNPYDEIEIGMVEILTKRNKRVVLKGYMIDDHEEHIWSRNLDKFAVVLWELQFRNGTPGNVLLKIDFEKMDMEIVEEFNRNNLLEEK